MSELLTLSRQTSPNAAPLRRQAILDLQRTIGNRETGRLLRRLARTPPAPQPSPVQAKLTVGRPDDAYEREADAAASRIESGQTVDRISRLAAGGPDRGVHRQPEADEDEVRTASVQRKCAECEDEENAQRQVEEEEEEAQASPLRRQEEEEEVQATSLQRQEEEEEEAQAASLQRQEEEEEEAQTLPLRRQQVPEEDEEPLQMQAAEEDEEPVQMRSGSGEQALDTDRAAAAMARAGGGSPLGPAMQAKMEHGLGADFSDVRIHTGAAANEAADAINARAFTRGSDIYMGRGASPADHRLMAHELTHTVQQGAAHSLQQVQRRQSNTESRGERDTGDAARGLLEGSTGKAVRKAGRISREQFLRKAPDPSKGDNVKTTLKFNTGVFVQVEGGKSSGWYQIVTEAGEQGWVPKAAVATNPPEPSAELYTVRSGDKAINLAGRWYGPPGGWKRWWMPGSDDAGDARFYVGALAFANKGREGMPSPKDLSERDAWMGVQVVKGLNIWKPSKGFLKTLKGKVSSGSITKEVWEGVKKVAKEIWDFAVFAAAFIAGLLYGAGESIYDLFAGVVDLAKLAWSIGKSIIEKKFISNARKFWKDLKSIDIGALGKAFADKWMAPDPWDAGFFQGRVLGYVFMEILMLVASFGVLTAIKWTGKFAKIGALIAKLPTVARVTEAIKGTKAAAKLGKLAEGTARTGLKTAKGAATVVLSGGRVAAKGAMWAAKGVYRVGTRILRGTWSVVEKVVNGVKTKVYYFYDRAAKALKEIPHAIATTYVKCSRCRLTARARRKRARKQARRGRGQQLGFTRSEIKAIRKSIIKRQRVGSIAGRRHAGALGHAVPDATCIRAINDPQAIMIARNGNWVFYRNGTIVITPAGRPSLINTAFGRGGKVPQRRLAEIQRLYPQGPAGGGGRAWKIGDHELPIRLSTWISQQAGEFGVFKIWP